MGTEHYVIDKVRFRRFWLGKHLNISKLRTPATPVQVYEALGAVWSGVFRFPIPKQEEDEWLAELSALLWAFCESAGWKVDFRDDAGDHDDEYHENGTERCIDVYSRYAPRGGCHPDPLADTVATLASEAADLLTANLVLES